MKFFLLAHNPMSLICLNKLIKNKQIPDLVVIHKYLSFEKLKESFYSPIEKTCKKNKIRLFKVNKLEEIKDIIKGSDFGICAGFMQIISEEIFSLPEKGIFNLHCGKLPKYRGRAPISRAIINGDRNITVTIHKIDAGVDSGDICIEDRIRISDKDDVNSLYKKCSDKSAELISNFVNRIKRDKIKLKKQRITKKANLRINEDERKINWNKVPGRIFNLIRALKSPYPNSYSYYNLKRIYFNKAEILNRNWIHTFRNGEIAEINNESIIIRCRGGYIKAFEMKDEDNKIIDLKKTFSIKSKFE
jgi:methionyl-tRNA formyltransferase